MVKSTSENMMLCSTFQTFERSNQTVLLTEAFLQLPSGFWPKSEHELSKLSQSEPQRKYLIANEPTKNVDEKQIHKYTCDYTVIIITGIQLQGIIIIVLTTWGFIIFVERSDLSLGTLYHFEHPLNKENVLSEVKNAAQLTWGELQLLLAQASLNRVNCKDQGQTVLHKNTSSDQLLSGSVPESLHELLLLSQTEFQPEYLIAYKPSIYLENKQMSIRTYNEITSIYKEVIETQHKLMKAYVEIASTTHWRNFDTTILSLPSAMKRDLQDASPGLEVVPHGSNNVLCVVGNATQNWQQTWRTSRCFWSAPSLLRVNKDDEAERSNSESHDFKCTELHNADPVGVTQPIVHSSTECVEQENLQISAPELPGIGPLPTLKLAGALEEAVSSETVDDQDMFKRIMGLLLSELNVRGCRDLAGLTSYNTERLTVYVMSRQPLRRIVGALERLAVAPADERDSTVQSIELFRLISFEKWPHIGKMSTLKFSLAGFHYAGSSDTVTCHSCCLSLRGWTGLAQPLDTHLRRSDGRCRLIGDPSLSSNVPLSKTADAWSFSYDEASRAANLSATTEGTGVATAAPSSSSVAAACYSTIFRCFTSKNVSTPGSEDFTKQSGVLGFLKDPTTIPRSSEREMFDAELRDQRQREELWKFESYRLRSYDGMWQHGHIVQPRELARSGFHYTGPGDRVQCAFCQGALRNWEEGDKPDELHAKHFNYCRFVQGHDVGNVPIPFWSLSEATCATAGATNNASGITAPEGLGIFSSVPKHVDFAVESRRLSTFATWPPSHPLRADSLAQAGFFFTGIEDAVTCFFCTGTVSGWKAGGDPWLEHARRFPTCPYVLQVKGPDIVEQRSILNASASGSGTQRTSFAVDPREIRARMDTPCVRVILKMDYPAELVREVIQRRLSTIGRDHETSEELLADIFSFHDEKQRTTHAASDSKAAPVMPIVVSQPSAATPASSSYSDGLLIATAASAPALGESNFASATVPDRASTSMATQRQPPDEENRQLKTQLTCKICMDAVVGIIFLPCGHLVSCAACAPALTSCPICRVSVRGTARVTF